MTLLTLLLIFRTAEDVTDLSLSDKFFEQMPTGVDRIYAPSNELTSLRILAENCNATEIDFSQNKSCS